MIELIFFKIGIGCLVLELLCQLMTLVFFSRRNSRGFCYIGAVAISGFVMIILDLIVALIYEIVVR